MTTLPPSPTLSIWPYAAIDGVPTMRDSDLASLWATMEREGTSGVVFRDGSIQSAEEFVRAMKNGSNQLYAWVDEQKIPYGVFWLNDIEARSAKAHFCTFRRAWGRCTTPMVKMALFFLFGMRRPDGSKVFDLITALPTADNPLAVKAVEKAGFKRVGVVPKAIYDAHNNRSIDGVLMCATAESVTEEVNG